MAGQDSSNATGDDGRRMLASIGDLRDHGTEIRIALPFGMVAFAASVASLAICYGSNIANAILGISLPLNEHLQAALMGALAALAIVALWRDHRKHGRGLPVALGAIALVILLATLYLGYDARVEAVAYVLLVIAALANQNFFLGVLVRTVRDQAARIAALNLDLERTVESQGSEIGRLGRLARFLPPQVAELVVADEEKELLNSHRRYIACLFCDMRNFTSVSESAEPEEVMAMLQAFHDRIGSLVIGHNGTIGFRSGDGLMAFFNDPLPCEEPVLEALRLALDIRESFEELRRPWSGSMESIGIGIGIASGYVTLGTIGFQGGADYTAFGGAVNLAARLCDRAEDGEILISQRAFGDAVGKVDAEPLGAISLKGFRSPVEIYRLVGLKPASGAAGAPFPRA